MNKKDKRKFTPAFKVKVALEALKGQSTTAELAKTHQLHPSQILDWKKTLSQQAEQLFTNKDKQAPVQQQDNAELYEQIGRLQMEINFLKKKLSL